ncbi:MAG: hypothetical protein QOF54_1066 [Solirubrobacteraceae bacterium]|nr:hypothetical protein [Solirubrobacteraceae bacterium]
MTETTLRPPSDLLDISNAMVRLHKTQFGRGPTKSRTHWAGPDALMCLLSDILLPAERQLAELGQDGRVRDTRTAFQAATRELFINAVEQIVYRKVIAFASAIDVEANTAFEVFAFEPRAAPAASADDRQNGDAPADGNVPAA